MTGRLPLLAGAACLVLAAAAGARSVGDTPAETSEIVSAVSDCATAVMTSGFDAQRLVGAGWKYSGKGQASMRGVPVEQRQFAREGGNVVNVVQLAGQDSATCVTVARLSSAAQAGEIGMALVREFGALDFASYNGDRGFKTFLRSTAPQDIDNTMIGNRHRFTIKVDQTGEAPSVTILMTPKKAEQ